jgi:hypothetical protein
MEPPVFYVAHYPNSELACKMLSVCVESIQKYYPDSDCWVLYTPSKHPVTLPTHPKLHVEENPILNSSVVGAYKKYLDSGETRKAIFLQDTVILKGIFSQMLNLPFGFVWHFSQYSSTDSIEIPYFRSEVLEIINNHPGLTWVGCMGGCLFSDRPSLLRLWAAIDFMEYTSHPMRAKAIMDLERIIAIHAYAMGLIPPGTIRSLCGSIFDMPNAYEEWYTGQDLMDIERIPYAQSAVKAFCRRLVKES